VKRLLSFALLFLATMPALAVRGRRVRASFYAPKFEGRKMANGHRYHAAVKSAASRAFPLGTLLHVTGVTTGKSVLVRVTDRGPWNKRYGLDLSRSAFIDLGFKVSSGWGLVDVQEVTQ
jgi:rare lipoprotein A